MISRNLTVRELYASIPATQTIYSFYTEGLKEDNDRLAVSAMEELIRRGDTDLVMRGLKNAFDNKEIKLGTTTTSMIARSLMDVDRTNSLLRRFGEFLSRYEESDSCPVDAFAKELVSSFKVPARDRIKDDIKKMLEDTDFHDMEMSAAETLETIMKQTSATATTDPT